MGIIKGQTVCVTDIEVVEYEPGIIRIGQSSPDWPDDEVYENVVFLDAKRARHLIDEMMRLLPEVDE